MPNPTRLLVRRLAIGVAALLVLLLIGAAIFTATFDVNRYKPQIVSAVQERTARTLRFDGDLSLTLFPRIAVRLPPTTLSEPRRDEVFARMESAAASVALLPLIRREIVVDAIRLQGLQATIVRRKDGTTNVDDLLKAQGAPAANGKAEPATEGATTTIGSVRLEDADLTLRDLAAGRTIRVSDFDLRAGRYGAGSRMPVAASGSLAVSEPALAARVSVEAELEWGGDGGLRAVRDLALKGDGRFKQQPVTVDARAEQLVGGTDRIDVRDLVLSASLRGESGGKTELKLAAPRLEASQARAAGDRIELTVTRSGAESLDARVLVEGVRGSAARLEATAVKVAAQAKSGSRTTRLDLAGGLVASVDDRTLRFDQVGGEVVVEDPDFGPKAVRLPVSASGSIDGRRETVALRFESRGEGLDARGRVNVAGFEAPRVTFDVDAAQVDADRYLLSRGPEKAGASGGAAAAPAAAPSDEKLDFGALKGLNLAGTARIAKLRVKGTDVSDLRATVKGSDGRLEIAPLALRAHGGSLDARIVLDARGNRVAADGMLAGIQLRQLIGTVGGRAAVEGRASGRFDFAAAGGTVGQMKRSLAGTVAVDVRDGALIGIDLADLIGSASNFLQSRGRQTGALDENKRTPFSELSASVRIKDGVAFNDDLKARSPQLSVTGSGRMDIVSTELDYALRAQVLPVPATQLGALRSMVGLTVPVKITGPLEQPSYAVDWAPIAADLLLRRATGRPDAPAVNQMLEGLGELLRRKK